MLKNAEKKILLRFLQFFFRMAASMTLELYKKNQQKLYIFFSVFINMHVQ
jgi:hypothetical protein